MSPKLNSVVELQRSCLLRNQISPSLDKDINSTNSISSNEANNSIQYKTGSVDIKGNIKK